MGTGGTVNEIRLQRKMMSEIEKSKAFSLRGSMDYASGAVVSKTLLKKPNGNITLFSFDKGEGLTEHTSPFDALVQILDGKAEITVGGNPNSLNAGEGIILPANVPHALKAVERFKMILTMIKE